MKQKLLSCIIILLSFLIMYKSEVQILKKLGQKVKDDAAWRAKVKTDNEIAKGLDTLIELPKRIIDKKKKKSKTIEVTDGFFRIGVDKPEQ